MLLRRVKRSDLDYICGLAVKGLTANPLYGFNYDIESIKKLCEHFYRTKDVFFVILEDDGATVGWFVGIPDHGIKHSYITGMSQVYYQCELSGFKALAALRIVHEAFFNFAEARKYQIVVTSSVLASKEIFEKVLMKDGWLPSSGQLLVKLTRFHPGEPEHRGGRQG